MEKNEYKVIMQEGNGEVIEKRSRFISHICFVKTVEQADIIIQKTKKKHHDARHTCFAYIIEETPQKIRFSDDGEPSGTAAKPMLDVLVGENISNVLLVCTRYFGGTLLGTGGLVRAYQGAAKEALADAVIGISKQGLRIKISSDYEDNGKIQYIIEQRGLQMEHSEYFEKVNHFVCIPIEMVAELKDEIIEKTAARSKIKDLEAVFIVEKL